MDRLRAIPAGDGALLCPNHSFAGDGAVMLETGRRAPRPFHIMAAWQLFTGHGGLDGWLMQKQGCFSVDREGSDRRSLRAATEILAGGRFLVVFPEGENYHLNDRLTPLKEGVAFMAASAVKDMAKGTVWLVPVAIRYRFETDVAPRLEAALAALGGPVSGGPIANRILAFGEAQLARREREILEREFTGEALPGRIQRLMGHLIARHEGERLGKTFEGEEAPGRVKRIRAKILADETRDDAAKTALADLHLAVQLFSYPGDYVTSSPTPERMAETLEKFSEDLTGEEARPVGKRQARVVIGEPIDVRAAAGHKRPRQVAEDLTGHLEASIASLMK